MDITENTSIPPDMRFLNMLRDAVIVMDSEGTITFINHAVASMLNVSREEMVGGSLRDRLIVQTEHGQSANVDTLLIIPTLQEKKFLVISEKTSGNHFVARRDRSQFPASFMTIPERIIGEGDGMTLIFYDVSDEEMIEKSKSEFVSLISHQLRTPVNITSWYTEKLVNQKKGDLNEKQKQYLDEITISNRRIIDLVSAIVNVSRTDLDRLKSKLETVDIISAIEEETRIFSDVVTKKEITVERNYETDSIEINQSDREYITVIIHALFNNAFKYNKQGGLVEITVRKVSAQVVLDVESNIIAEHDGVVVSIRDTGLGIPDHQKEGIFTKLFRADNVKALDVTGLGLGLYVTRSFVEVLDGHIWFKSQLHEGSTFSFYLPG